MHLVCIADRRGGRLVVVSPSDALATTSSLPADPLLRRIADHLGTLTGDAGCVVRVDEAGGSWAVAVGSGGGGGAGAARPTMPARLG
jgi:hypothetical protein